jgi:hypothetical protein
MRRRRRKRAYKDLVGPPCGHQHTTPPRTRLNLESKVLDAATAANLQQRAWPHHPQHRASTRDRHSPRNNARHPPSTRRRASGYDIAALNKRHGCHFRTTFRRLSGSRHYTKLSRNYQPDLGSQLLDGSPTESAHTQLDSRRRSRSRQHFSNSPRGQDGSNLADRESEESQVDGHGSFHVCVVDGVFVLVLVHERGV